MIKTYSYLETSHSKLHEFVMAFFVKIEKETGPYNTKLYVKEFYDNVVSHHPKILEERFKLIYEEIKTWKQPKRSKFCKSIRESNEIKSICEGKIKPAKLSSLPKSLKDIIDKLFKTLYEDVLKGSDWYKKKYGNLLDHYHDFKKYKKNDYEYCPACGIIPMKGITENKRDQYDHYLAKDLYPFSSVNFRNLVPICSDCNSIEVKSNKDVLSYSGSVFYPFDGNNEQIKIDVIIKNKKFNDLHNIKWEIMYSSPKSKDKRIEAWKKIYDIDKKHIPHITSNINRWFKAYYEYVNNSILKHIIADDSLRSQSYLISLENEKVLKRETMRCLINANSNIAVTQSKAFSRIFASK